MENCGSVAAVDFLPTNDEVTHISHRCLSYQCRPATQGGVSAEVVLVARRRGPVYQLDVVTEGDSRHWTVTLPPTREIGAHSCLDERLFCDIVSVAPLRSGFVVMDRHRVSEFRFSWQPDAHESLVWQIGKMNALATHPAYTSLRFPSAAAVYQPLNGTHIDETVEITAFVPHADSRIVLVTDTGNHRVVMINTTAEGHWAFAGQFGVTGEARSDGAGLDTPWGLAVAAPAWEGLFRPVFANCFVADRRNARLVKLDLGYAGRGFPLPGEAPALVFGGAYGPSPPGAGAGELLGEPVGVAVYRHYVLVADARENAVVVLTVDHADTSRLRFVTRLRPAPGVRLAGSVAASPLGYLWFSSLAAPDAYGVGSVFLPEALRWSVRPTRLADLVAACQNDTWYHAVLRFDGGLYRDFVGDALNAAGLQWLDPSRPRYVNAGAFNLTGGFDLAAFNRTVFGGRMRLCSPPPPPTAPPMRSGNSQGWNMAGRTSPALAAASRTRPCAVWWLLWLLGAWRRGARLYLR